MRHTSVVITEKQLGDVSPVAGGLHIFNNGNYESGSALGFCRKMCRGLRVDSRLEAYAYARERWPHLVNVQKLATRLFGHRLIVPVR